MIEIRGVTKTFGSNRVLDDVSFVAANGTVTGFLGSNGTGKSTTMRVLLGLITPNRGTALIDGVPYTRQASPMSQMRAVQPFRLFVPALAYTNNIARVRVDEVMDLTGLASVQKTKAGKFSLGMGQRLAIAAVLLGNPRNLVLDEPVNGLDAEGVKWVRDLCRNCVADGRAVLLSSPLMNEVALTADNLVIIGEARILRTGTVAGFVKEHSRHLLSVATPDAEKMRAMFAGSTRTNSCASRSRSNRRTWNGPTGMRAMWRRSRGTEVCDELCADGNPAGRHAVHRAVHAWTFGGSVHSEWCKMWSACPRMCCLCCGWCSSPSTAS